MLIGNWKMNGVRADLASIECLLAEIGDDGDVRDIWISLPTTLLLLFSDRFAGRGLSFGAQDCHPLAKGAHTGDISAEMLADAGARFVLLGHSERRTNHAESDASISQKVHAAWRAGLHPIVCVGETIDDYRTGSTEAVLRRQIAASIPWDDGVRDFTIAYEPAWAIGSGVTPSDQAIVDVMRVLRQALRDRDPGCAARLLYGGSVNRTNAAPLASIPNVDGLLVGGSSLDPRDFACIVRETGALRMRCRHPILM